MDDKKIFPAMIAIMRDSEAIAKCQTNKQQGFRYRGIDDVYNMLHPVMAKHGVFMTTEVLDISENEKQSKTGGLLFYKKVDARFTFWAEDGSSVSSTITGEAMDSGDKAINKALAIAHKYCLFQAFCLPTEDSDKDPDSQTHEVAKVLTPTAQTKLKLLIDRARAAKMCDAVDAWLAANIPDNNIDELTSEDCESLIVKLNQDGLKFKKDINKKEV